MAAAAVAVVVVGLGAFVMTRDSGAPPEASALQLTAGPSDALASCIVPSAEIIAQTEVAFEGTVTAIDGDVVTLSVDDWFTGGDAEVVTILAPSGFEALIGSVPFAEGEVFLVTATNGIVNYCGLSGPATPELRALFQDAFPG